MLPINNAANSLGLGSKKYPKHFTPNASRSTILIVFLLLFFLCKYEKQKNKLKEKIYILKIKSIKTGEKI